MTRIDPNTERLICRRLDGELNDVEELALDRQLIRDPDARRLMEEYRRIDEMSHAALSRALRGEDQPDGGVWDPAPSREIRARAHRRGLWLVPGAIAAALLALVIPRPDLSSLHRPAAAPQRSMIPEPSTGSIRRGAPTAVPMRSVNMPRARRDTGRELLGVVGDDGNVYWIEVDRSRTIRTPRGVATSRPDEQM